MFTTALLFAALVSPAALADGACCNPDEAFCIYTAEDVCVGDGGTYYGDGVDCAVEFVECEVEDSSLSSTTHPEPEPEGSCCLDADADGINECVDAVTNDWCSHNFGTWYAGSDCVAVGAECEGDPEPDLGACCREETCIDNVPEDECKDVGTWYPGAICDDLTAECGLDDDTGIFEDPDLGACCLDEECIETTADECWADEGAFYGPGSSCDDTFVECCGDDDTGTTAPVGTGTSEPVDAAPSLSCSTVGGTRSGLPLMLPFALVGMAVGFRRREMR
jgi:uncharacterized protein (TIGR03382 family)